MSDAFIPAPGARPDVTYGDEPLRVAVVGTGGWWSLQHARVFWERPDVELVAIVGRSPGKTAERAVRFGTTPYTDLDEMMSREKPDLVTMSLPAEVHHDETLRVIRAGIPLLVEKPLVLSLRDADHLLEEAADRSLFFGIDFNHRWGRPVQLARAAISEGRLGRLTFATWRFGGEGGSQRTDENLVDAQCHGFDLLEFLCGPIVSVAAEMTEFASRGHSNVVIALGFESGAVGSFVASYDSSYAYPGTQHVEINGTAGRVLVEDTVRRFTYHGVGSELGETWEAGYFNDLDRMWHRAFDRHVDAVLAALRDGEEPPVHARAGRRALALALASVESFETGRRVDTTPGAGA